MPGVTDGRRPKNRQNSPQGETDAWYGRRTDERTDKHRDLQCRCEVEQQDGYKTDAGCDGRMEDLTRNKKSHSNGFGMRWMVHTVIIEWMQKVLRRC